MEFDFCQSAKADIHSAESNIQSAEADADTIV